ncbi:MAG: type restriction-modification system methyltransferase subunit, partial [Aeromicrobium sp.]|nr:type restriction-modification system methyltransferase subunit [Aeromicrobium sp.]
MLPPDVRRRVDAIWDRIWASGISNPLVAIEYISTVLLVRRLDDLGDGSAPSTWDEITVLVAAGDPAPVADLMARVQGEFGIGGGPGSSTMWRDLATLRQVLADVRDLDIGDRNGDILGDLFEFMLNHLSTAGHFGQFRTPRHL